MRILIAGATGAIGRPLTRALTQAGHVVVGTSRFPERVRIIGALGARGAVMDALDPEATLRVVADHRPDVVVNQLTALPDVPDLRNKDMYVATDRLRREGNANLLAAARGVGARRFVAQSIAFAFRAEGDKVKAEDAPLATDAPVPFGPTVQAVQELEAQVAEADWTEGIVLRYGWLYGPGTYYAADGFVAREVRRRRYPIVGSGSGLFSFLHVEDAAAMTVSAIEGGAPGVYNAVDDEPIALRDWLPLYAESLGAKPPLRVPRVVARIAAGAVAAGMATELRGASNASGKKAFGWNLIYPTVRSGFEELRIP
jgi:nucleoside-diphosphate-sugar epimerase